MRCVLLLAAFAALAGCASQPRIVPVAVQPPPPVAAAPAFAGYGDLAVPPRLADGSYVTPNRSVSAAGAIWHLRAGLNVAALSCRGPQEAALIAGYNALIQRHRASFDGAYRQVSREHGNAAGFDGAMTRLYNYYALPPAQSGLCAAAARVLEQAALVPDGGLAGFAPAALANLERPYTDVFAAQEAWLASRYPRTATPVILAAVAPAPVPVQRTVAPQLTVDPAVLRIP